MAYTGYNTASVVERLAQTAQIDFTDECKQYADQDGVVIFDETFHANGRVAIRSFVDEDDYRHGLREKFDQDGVLLKSTMYRDGCKHGIEKTYRADGSLRTTTHYKDGERHGERRKYRADGSLKKSTMYVEDKKHGLEKIFNRNGTYREIGRYDCGDHFGKHSYYTQNGELATVTLYDPWGRAEGLEKEFYTSEDMVGTSNIGKIKTTIPYKQGMRHGTSRSYSVNGKVMGTAYHVLELPVPQPIYWLTQNWKDVKAFNGKKLAASLWEKNKADTLGEEKEAMKKLHAKPAASVPAPL